MKYILSIFILLFLTSCSSLKTQNLYINNELKIENEKQIYTFDRCTNDSFYSNFNDKSFGKLYIEHISLNTNCSWNSFARGDFEYLFKTTMKLKSMKMVKRFDYGSYEFTTYLIDDKYYLDLIYEFAPFEDSFVLDYQGVLFEKMIKKFDSKYKNEYKNKQRFNKTYENSLVRMNFINGYFSIDSEPLIK